MQQRRLYALLIAGAYGIALFSPVVNSTGVAGSIFGFQALTMGWHGYGVIPECANVLLVVGTFAYLNSNDYLAALSGMAAFGLSLTAPSVFGISPSELRAGFFVWTGTMLLLAALGAHGMVASLFPRQSVMEGETSGDDAPTATR